MHRAGQISEPPRNIRHPISEISEGGQDSPTDTDPGIHEGIFGDSDPRLSRLVPLRRLLDQGRTLIELVITHRHSLGK